MNQHQLRRLLKRYVLIYEVARRYIYIYGIFLFCVTQGASASPRGGGDHPSGAAGRPDLQAGAAGAKHEEIHSQHGPDG